MAEDHSSKQDVPDRTSGQDSLVTNCPPRGPRTLLLRRGENGFGFTLRHFIVYPPESCYMLPGHERKNIDEPMDTIFVKRVHANSPAADAGLRTGDRVVSVDGNPTRGEQYASVVQRIQQAGPWLRLLVVSKEDDILQKYFGETAHNPETNQRPRLRSPERLSQKQRRSVGLLPSNSSRMRQSWVCSASSSSPGLESQPLDESKIYGSAAPVAAATMPRKKSSQERWKSTSPTVQHPSTPNVSEPVSPGASAMSCSLLSRLRGPSVSHQDIDRFQTYDGRSSRPGSVYSRADSERLYDRIKDPIYERVKNDKCMTESLDRHRFPVSRAEPQVPIYRSVARRAAGGPRHASETIEQEGEDPESRRGSVSPSKESYSSFDSNSTLTGECPGDSVIMSRIRKSCEQKEEFLRRPSHPIGWFLAEKAVAPRNSARSQGIIQREFYARPQKLQKQVWPPEGQGSAAKGESSKAAKPTSSSKSEQPPLTNNNNNNNNNNSCNNNNSNCNNNHHACSANGTNGKAAPVFVSTLSRIHENSAGSAQQQSQELRNGTSSLPSSPGPEKKILDKFPVPPQGLQIVSRRTEQFESGCLMSDEDEPVMGDRTHLYESELSRLTNKKSVPNVAVRKREFESKVESQDQRRTVNRESKSLEAEPTATSDEPVQLRARSNSFESWAAINEPTYKSVRHTWQDQPEEDPDDKRNVSAERQDSYLKAVRDQIGSNPNTNSNGVVLRRPKNTQISDEDRSTRRVSYLKATWAERMHIDSDLELSDSEPVHTIINRDSIPVQSIPTESTMVRGSDVEREGLLCVKFTVLDGKRSSDRSWKQAWGVLRGPLLFFYKDRHSQSPSMTTDGDTVPNVDMRCSVVDVADDYTKRKNVLRVANTNAEVLLQTEDTVSMALWLRSLQKHAAAEKPSDASTTSKQLAVPQTPTSSANSSQQVQRLSPLPGHKSIRKLTSFRNRSPTGQSPVSKTRKPSQNFDMLTTSPSPKSKTWKVRVAKQLRKMHSQTGSPSSPTTTQLPPTGATFKVPLEFCRSSSFSEYVPLIVEMCTKIVEERGLEVIGIYRVPGNTAAISQLTESVNKGFEHINVQDPRWSDVNVISSLLKSFFRQLPDSLLTATLYPMFIDADKIEDPQRRMATIRKLLRDLPEHHFETLKHLMFHLKKVVEHSEANKMDAKNMAIVFGPTLMKASGSRDNVMTMVTDMSHQCRIVESLLNNVDWFFMDDDSDDLSRLSINLSLPADSNDNMDTNSQSNHNLLLNNIHKIEGMREMITAKDIVSSIISAANRKIQRRKKGHDETDNDDHEQHDKLKSKHETESLPVIRQSMAINERLCSVSEIVLMHENKTLHRDKYDRSSKHAEAADYPIPTPRQKYSNSQSQRPAKDKPQTEATQSDPSPRTSNQQEAPKVGSASACATPDRMSVISSGSTDTKQSNDEVTMRSYANLSATTQERIRRFEQETKAMLQRDQHRHRREAEKREEDKRRIEMEWQLAKKEMEEDEDDLDNIVSPKLLAERWSSLNDRSQKSDNPEVKSASQQTRDVDKNGINKKLKTDKEVSPTMNLLTPSRYGSLDSLHEFHNSIKSSSSPTSHHQGISGEFSDDGSDLLTSLTSTFDRKWKSLNPSSVAGSGPASITPTSPPSSSKQFPGFINTAKDVRQLDSDKNPVNEKVECAEMYRDPSLHKAPMEIVKSSIICAENIADEKDIDSTRTPPPDLIPNNDRLISNSSKKISRAELYLDASEKDLVKLLECTKLNQAEEKEKSVSERASCSGTTNIVDPSYSNKLERFERLTKANLEPRSRLKRSESLNKRTENRNAQSKLKRSESLNKSDGSEQNTKLKRSESLTKTEKTESNISKRRQSVRKESTKLKRKNGMPERSIKRRHTVGGTKDFDKIHWLDNKLQDNKTACAEDACNSDCASGRTSINKSQLRTSSPDLSSNRYNLTDASFLIEVSFRGPSNVIFNVTNASNARPQSLPDANLASKVFKVPLESHV